MEALGRAIRQGHDRLGQLIHRQAADPEARLLAGGIGDAEGRRGEAREQEAVDQPRENVVRIAFPGQVPIGQHQPRSQDPDRQARGGVAGAQQLLTGPLAGDVAVGIGAVETDGLRQGGHADGGDHGDRLAPLRQRQPHDLGGADDIGSAEVAVVEPVIDQGGAVDDGLDAVGQPVVGGGVQPQPRLADVAGHHLQVLLRQGAPARRHGRLEVGEAGVETLPGGLGLAGPDQANQPAAAAGEAFQPGLGDPAAQKPVRPGEQHRPDRS